MLRSDVVNGRFTSCRDSREMASVGERNWEASQEHRSKILSKTDTNLLISSESSPPDFNLCYDITMFSFLPGTFPDEILCRCPDSSTCSFVTTRVKINRLRLPIPRFNNI